MTYNQMMALLAIASARAEPIIPEGWTHANGYILRGPRGNKKVVVVKADGMIDGFSVKLWLDGIAYGDAKMVKPKIRKKKVA